MDLVLRRRDRFRACDRSSTGERIVLVEDGRVVGRNLRRQTPDGRGSRRGGAPATDPSLRDVRFAVLETNGQISFIPLATF